MDRWLHSGFLRKNTAFITLFILYFTLLFSQPAASMPAYPGIVQGVKPDGSAIQLHIRGAEHFNWMEDSNGYTVVEVHGWYQYTGLATDGSLKANVDVYREGSYITTTANDGAYTDATNLKGGGSHTHNVCNQGTTVSSNILNTSF